MTRPSVHRALVICAAALACRPAPTSAPPRSTTNSIPSAPSPARSAHPAPLTAPPTTQAPTTAPSTTTQAPPAPSTPALGTPTTLSVMWPGCSSLGHLRGEARREDHHLAVVRFEPPHTPFTVQRVRVRLHHDPSGDDQCAAQGALEVVAFLGDEERPPASPHLVTTTAVASTNGDDAVVEADLPGLVVHDGQHLFAGLRVRATATSATCLITCGDYVDSDVNWWSHAKNPPFRWRALEDHVPALVNDLAVEVDGF